MSKSKKFVLRVDAELFKQIEKWADDEFRSINGQLEWIIYKSLKDAKRLPNKKTNKQNETDNDGNDEI